MRGWAVLAALALAACGSSKTNNTFDAGSYSDGGNACAGFMDCQDYGNSHQPNEPDGGYLYFTQPPCSGNHNPSPMPWGVYTTPVPRDRYVHNMEHGGIVLLYNCPSGCPDVTSAFQDLYNAQPLDQFNEIKIVVTPDPLYDGGFAAAAWDHVYTPTVFNVDAFRCFISTYIDHGPEDAP